MTFSLFDLAFVGSLTGAPALDPDAAAYIAAVEAADAQALEPAVRAAINDFVVGCKADGIWAAIKASCILAGARTLTGALVPLVGAAPTNVSGNFVSGDYDRKTGLKGDGSSKRLNANITVSNFSGSDNQHLSAFVTNLPSDSGWLVNNSGMVTGTSGIGRSAPGAAVSRSQSQTNTVLKSVFGLNFIGMARASSSQFRHLLELDNEQTVNLSSQTPATESFHVFADGGSSPNFSDARISFYSIGNNISLTNLRSRVIDLMNAIEATLTEPITYDVFFIAGQSNSCGRVLTNSVNTPSYIDSDTLLDTSGNPIKVWNGTSISNFVFGQNGPNGNGKYFVSLNNTKNWSQNHVAVHLISANSPNPILIVQVTDGGTMLSPLSRSSNNKGSWTARFDEITDNKVPLLLRLKERYDALKSFAAANNITLNPKALLWHQGEADYDVSINTSLTTTQRQNAIDLYEQDLAAMVSYFRTEITGEQTPIFSGTVPAQSTKYSAGIRNAMLSFANTDTAAYWLDTDDLELLSDNLHFAASTNLTFGQWIFDTYSA
jgi:hypothetical protein